MKKPGIAMILYTVREPAKEDLLGTLKRIREIGFEYVQWSGMPPMPAGDIREALDAAGLQAIAGHVGLEPFEEDIEGAIRDWKTIGARDVAPGGMMADCRDTLEGWLEGAKRLNAVGAQLREAGMRLSYHNHDFEFETFEGDDRCKLDILYGETGAKNLYAELDLAWVNAGGADPVDYLKKYAGRCPVIHCKDMKAELEDGRPHFVPLGEGVLDWPAIFKTVQEANVEWLVYEQDSCDIDVFECCQISYEFLSANVG
jgi:sugar phosphate isomerase/epimerase